MSEGTQNDNLIELAADVVAAYVSKNTVSASELPNLIHEVHSALEKVSRAEVEAPSEPLRPAVPIRKSVMATSAVKKDQYPEEAIPQIALFGRSNAGKSTLINTLIERKNLARTSSTPGKTRLINFYHINAAGKDDMPLEWFFVDLPGYGYAKASKTDRAHWLRFIEEYLLSEKNKICWQLLDIRHKPSEQDQALYQILIDNDYHVTLIANKVDKISKNQRAKSLSQIAKTMQVNQDSIVVFSAITKEGKSILQDKAETYISNQI